MTDRRRAIEHFCRLFLNDSSAEIQACRSIYRDLVIPIVPDPLPSTDIASFIKGVGDELFNSRPASMVYIMVFLEFVYQVYSKMDIVCKDQIVMSSANVIEKTTFNPIRDRPGLFRIITCICINIFSSVKNVFY